MAGVVHPVVIDNGSHTCTAGFGGDYEPKIVIPSAVGYPISSGGVIGNELKDYFNKKDFDYKIDLDLKYPIERGIITNWDEMEKIWQYIFQKLEVAPEESSIVLTEAICNSKDNREEMAKIMFEKFNARTLCITNQASLSVCSSGFATGISVSVGHGITQIVPVYKGSIIQDAAVQWEFGGQDMTDYLTRMLIQCGCSFDSHSQTETVRNIKEKCCYVAPDFEQELQTTASEKYKLPNKKVITIGKERLRTPEVMFQPSLIGDESDGIHKRIYNSILKCDNAIRKDMFDNIVLSGGSTMFKGFAERMLKEIRSITAETTKIKVIPPTGWWPGNAKFTSLLTSNDMSINKEEFDEQGLYNFH
ncbi:actin-3 [Octopus bimaculoides]|uniref:Actin, cytoplasmic n=1 Tax=Octopus bimaculoides TaxID=37653 RepID=A0A0L8IG68_OCTBM|nr:actin-3 [Octopus bimaculoides]|eukprot:XP_014767973.1 PREDICTED: actin-3-like [Octopus bimaculoides]